MNLSWIALGVSIVATLPQLYQTLSTGLVRDHNPWSPAIAMVANFILAAHALSTKDSGLLGFALWFVMVNAVILTYKMKEPTTGGTRGS